MTQSIREMNSSTLLLSKSILARDSILKRLDAGQIEFGEERAKVSQLYQQLERRTEVAKLKHHEDLEEIDRVSLSPFRRYSSSTGKSKTNGQPSISPK